MTLQVENVFGENQGQVSDNGYRYVVDDGNVGRRALITFTGADSGSYNNMFDLDDTSYFGSQIATADGTEYYITIDCITTQVLAVVTAYFSSGTSSGGITVTTTLQYSEDGTTYTDMASAAQTGSGETFKNHGERPAKFRYLRFKMTATGGGSGHTNIMKVYFLRVSNG